jgi:hypothetical protein
VHSGAEHPEREDLHLPVVLVHRLGSGDGRRRGAERRRHPDADHQGGGHQAQIQADQQRQQHPHADPQEQLGRLPHRLLAGAERVRDHLRRGDGGGVPEPRDQQQRPADASAPDAGRPHRAPRPHGDGQFVPHRRETY